MIAFPSSAEPAGPVLFFDGECGLCQRFVRLLLWLDRGGGLRYAPLQGPTAQAYLRSRGWPTTDFDTLLLVPDWSRREQVAELVRTDGAIAALRATGRRGRILAALLAVLPRSWRDAAYRRVARWRQRLFGPAQPGAWARAGWADRFLDPPA